MKKLFVCFLMAALLAVSALALDSDKNWNAQTVTGSAYTDFSIYGLGLSRTIWVANDSSTYEVYVNWDGRATSSAEAISYGSILKAGENRAMDMQSKYGPKVIAVSEDVPVRVTVILNQ
ncbi:MAG: hypothetical protein KKG92_15455 [Gammaproteobacteria bacterium]|nr:hypothetical protein [Gammaproteobacteria bacterium]